MSNFKSIAIDGPSGAGKSTIAKKISRKIQYIYVDTGALYRVVGYYMIQNNISYLDEAAVTKALDNIEVGIKYINGYQHVFLNGQDISDYIRSDEVSAAASSVSAFKSVRDFLIELQRDFARKNNVIMDGRDIGTVVLPEADLKIFLTASNERRAVRRYKQLIKTDPSVDLKNVSREMEIRDKNDSSRAIAPLKQAEDAILVDSSDMTLNETINYIFNIITERLL